jgi:hypothetical protein
MSHLKRTPANHYRDNLRVFSGNANPPWPARSANTSGCRWAR